MLRDLGKLIVAKGFRRLPKVQNIARSGHTVYGAPLLASSLQTTSLPSNLETKT